MQTERAGIFSARFHIHPKERHMDTSTQAPMSPQERIAAAIAAGNWLIIDTLCEPPTHDGEREVYKSRKHDVLMAGGQLRTLAFNYNRATVVPEAIAVKLLKEPAFVRVDEHGDAIEWRNPPKQPEELQAGEQFQLAADETVAKYDEMTVEALKIRAMQMVGGETVKTAKKEDVIAFLIAAVAAKRALAAPPQASDPDLVEVDAEPDGSGMFGE